MIKTYEKHTIYFWSFTLVLCALSTLVEYNNFDNYLSEINKICFFLILVFGVMHGALDDYKGKKLMKLWNIHKNYLFYVIYTLIASLIIFSWWMFPGFTLFLFLIVASFHFGKEDTEFFYAKKKFLDLFFYFLRGSIIVLAPLFFKFPETIDIFTKLFVSESLTTFLSNIKLYINLFFILSLLSNLYFIFKGFENWLIVVFDLWSILALNYFFPPLVAFTLYFCFLHSFRHTISLSYDLNPNNFAIGLKIFIKKAVTLTLITAALFIFATVMMVKNYGIDSSILKVIFIGLASLTFPHILLEYILEKDEKRN